MDRTLNRFWPRARSKLYEEPKKLVAQGLAEATAGAHGRRPRTVYSITPAGRRALAAWLAAGQRRPGLRVRAHPQGLLRRERVDRRRPGHPRPAAGVGARADGAQHRGRLELSGGQRAVPGAAGAPWSLTGRFLDDYLEMIDRWAAWAGEIVDDLAADTRRRRPRPGRAGRQRSARRPPGPSGGTGRAAECRHGGVSVPAPEPTRPGVGCASGAQRRRLLAAGTRRHGSVRTRRTTGRRVR